MRKSLGVAALLALLVLPLTGSAGATGTTTTDPTKVCALVKVAAKANVGAGAKIGLSGKLLNDAVNAAATAKVDGDVFAYVCIKVDKVALTLRTDLSAMATPKDECQKGDDIGVDLRVQADLATGLEGGSVKVFVKVFVVADGDDPNKKAQEGGEHDIDTSAYLNLAALAKIGYQDVINACVGVDVDAAVDAAAKVVGEVEVGDGGGEDPKK